MQILGGSIRTIPVFLDPGLRRDDKKKGASSRTLIVYPAKAGIHNSVGTFLDPPAKPEDDNSKIFL